VMTVNGALLLEITDEVITTMDTSVHLRLESNTTAKKLQDLARGPMHDT